MNFDRLEWWHVAGGLALLGAATYSGGKVVQMVTGCTGPSQPTLIRQLASKWGPIFGAPVSTIMAISKIESGWRPKCQNVNARAMTRGGAWGAMAMTLTTAKGIAQRLATHPNASVRATLARWDGTGPGLLDADINVMMGAHELGRLTKEFREFKLVAGAYHQGAGKIRQMLRDKKAIPAELPPFGKLYVSRALEAHKGIA